MYLSKYIKLLSTADIHPDRWFPLKPTHAFYCFFNTVVTRRYALCINYNQYAQPQKMCHQGSYKSHGKCTFFNNYKSAQWPYEAHSCSWRGIYTNNVLLVCLYPRYKSVFTWWPVWNSWPMSCEVSVLCRIGQRQTADCSNKLYYTDNINK